MPAHLIKCKYGKVKFDITVVPSQCGMSFINAVSFFGVNNKIKLYEYFLNDIILGTENLQSDLGSGWGYSEIVRSNGRWNVNKFLLTDYLRPKNYKEAHLHGFCTYMELLEGPVVFNPNSGNMVQSFEINRNIIKVPTKGV